MGTTEAEQHADLVRRDIEEIWNEERYDLVEELYAEDFVHHDPAYPGEIRGPEGQEEFVRTYNTAFPGSPSISIEEILVDDDMVAVRWTGHGTHEETFMGIEPTQEEMDVSGMSMARIEDGKIAEMWSNYDALGMMSRIGAVEPPAE